MNQWNKNLVKQTFIDYFKTKNHTIYKGSSVIPVNDTTLLFINSGMNQFKPIFLGLECDIDDTLKSVKRIANSQKCIRAGGKHNDLDDVGKDTYHHTYFEMLGNWSFGDYFKNEAIEWAWDLLTNVYKIDPSRLYVTYYAGNESLNINPDYETREIWKKYLPQDRILPFEKENFWEMGNTGPCGPCTEIHYDHIGNRDASLYVNKDDPNVVEIWNLVFIQFERLANQSIKPLPNKHVDTGMGFERLCAVLQNKKSNYDTDIFLPIFEYIQTTYNIRPYTGKIGKEDIDKIDTAYRVIVDHLRTLAVAISDGCLPGTISRGYVVRRLVRRACRYSSEIMNMDIGFLSELIPFIVSTLDYQDIQLNVNIIKQIIFEEETKFSKTLDKGLKKFNKIITKANNCIKQNEIEQLYESFGFPIDLTMMMINEKNIRIIK